MSEATTRSSKCEQWEVELEQVKRDYYGRLETSRSYLPASTKLSTANSVVISSDSSGIPNINAMTTVPTPLTSENCSQAGATLPSAVSASNAHLARETALSFAHEQRHALLASYEGKVSTLLNRYVTDIDQYKECVATAESGWESCPQLIAMLNKTQTDDGSDAPTTVDPRTVLLSAGFDQTEVQSAIDVIERTTHYQSRSLWTKPEEYLDIDGPLTIKRIIRRLERSEQPSEGLKEGLLMCLRGAEQVDEYGKALQVDLIKDHNKCRRLVARAEKDFEECLSGAERIYSAIYRADGGESSLTTSDGCEGNTI